MPLAVAVAAPGCGEADDDGDVIPDGDGADDGAGDGSGDLPDQVLAELEWFGLAKNEAIEKAEAEGREWRISREDDEHFELTEDLVEGRVTFAVDDGEVTYAVVEHLEAPIEREGAENPADVGYVGLTEEAAIQRAEDEGRPARVVRRDDEHLAVTMDYSEDRLNFELDDGIVTVVTRG